ncbi:sialate O-acetylesterase [Coraliomargarita parva]|uniref:sialate O-acetylesterase n=1 Tax=Coraliomargarita parva TaxID=3014050 RepID=UPI0022B4677B|nr:sialate O-acetylesterase [Coraliomargarita parva]
MPAVFGDHMVLQRELPLKVWGWADPGEAVSVALAGQSAKTQADSDGQWELRFEPLVASFDPVEFKISGKNTIAFEDVLVGDVWLCSGQSNMVFELRRSLHGKAAMSEEIDPSIRSFYVKRHPAIDPMDDVEGHWAVSANDVKALAGFSAVGFYFGREIQRTQNVPVGLIGSNWGGTRSQSWTSLEGLQASPETSPYTDGLLEKKAQISKRMKVYEAKTLPEWQKALDAWKSEQDPKGPKPQKPKSPGGSHHFVTSLYNGMIHPLTGFAMKGAIWYQGEANAKQNAVEYASLFPALIRDWRQQWGQGDFPFIFVQLAGFKNGKGDWPVLREAQRRTLSVPNTAMAMALDVGEETDIHPKNKLVVGERLALAARQVAYGEDLTYSGPSFESMEVKGPRALVTFDHTDGGLMVGTISEDATHFIAAASGTEVQGFELAGEEGVFYPAQARILKNNKVELTSEQVDKPLAVRYAWSAWPEPSANLYNQAGLPTVPFTTEAWPPIVE